jgi:hypothetical protein
VLFYTQSALIIQPSKYTPALLLQASKTYYVEASIGTAHNMIGRLLLKPETRVSKLGLDCISFVYVTQKSNRKRMGKAWVSTGKNIVIYLYSKST